MKPKLITKTDVIIIIAALLLSFIVLFGMYRSSERLEAVVTVNGKVTEKIDLDKIEKEIVITPDTEPKVVIKANKGEIYFYSAECSDKICIKSGKLKKKGDTAVCLPAKTVITIVGNDVDAITY